MPVTKLLDELRRQQEQLPSRSATVSNTGPADYHGHPVALIASTGNVEYASGSPAPAWHATTLVDHDFESMVLNEAGIANNDGHCPRAHAETPGIGGTSPGSGTALVRTTGRRQRPSPGQRGRLPTRRSSPFWHSERLAGPLGGTTGWRYIGWLSPLLLLLPITDTGQRSRLEQQARSRAELVADLYRLYPNVVQPELIEQARVEARLRRAAGCHPG